MLRETTTVRSTRGCQSRVRTSDPSKCCEGYVYRVIFMLLASSTDDLKVNLV